MPKLNPTTIFGKAMREAKRQILTEGLARNDGNKTATARNLGISRTWLHRQLKGLGIDDRGVQKADSVSLLPDPD